MDKYRIAVLPFTNISADAENEYFSDGMTEELISKLSRLRDLKVIARTSVMQYKDTGKSVAEIGRELQVGTILEGSVRKAGDRLRITAQLVDVESQGHLWSQDYDRTLDDVFAIQSDVAESVADALQVTLGPGEKSQIEKEGTGEHQGVRPVSSWAVSLQQVHRRRIAHGDQVFRARHAEGSSLCPGLCVVGMVVRVFSVLRFSGAEVAYPKALQAVRESLALKSSLPEAYTVLGLLKVDDYDWAGAESAFQRAVELDPGAAMPRSLYGIGYLSAIGKHDEAVAELTRALELDPLSSHINNEIRMVISQHGRIR